MTRTGTSDDLVAVQAIAADSPEASDWNAADYLRYHFTVADHDGCVAGFLVWREVAGEGEVLNLAVDPLRRRRGIARELLETLPPLRMFLEVRASNLAAQKLYEMAGFRVIGRRPGYYRNPAEDGIVMERQK